MHDKAWTSRPLPVFVSFNSTPPCTAALWHGPTQRTAPRRQQEAGTARHPQGLGRARMAVCVLVTLGRLCGFRLYLLVCMGLVILGCLHLFDWHMRSRSQRSLRSRVAAGTPQRIRRPRLAGRCRLEPPTVNPSCGARVCRDLSPRGRDGEVQSGADLRVFPFMTMFHFHRDIVVKSLDHDSYVIAPLACCDCRVACRWMVTCGNRSDALCSTPTDALCSTPTDAL
eukprot:gene13199-biopygen10377